MGVTPAIWPLLRNIGPSITAQSKGNGLTLTYVWQPEYLWLCG